MCLMLLGALLLSQSTLFYGNPRFLSSIYCINEGNENQMI